MRLGRGIWQSLFLCLKITSSEYSHNGSGNMIKDLNSGITNIAYNFLNLPTQIMKSSMNISYIYTSTGEKLQNILPTKYSNNIFINNYNINTMKHTQIGWAIILICVLAFSFVMIVEDRIEFIIGFSSVFSLILLLFHKLSIEVDEKHIRYSYGLGIIHGKIELADIKSCKSVKYFPMGWGIRFKPGVILYNVSGRRAIELEIKWKSRKVMLGTDMPDEFAAYINSKIAKQ